MSKRLGEVLCTFGWAVAALIMWVATHQPGGSEVPFSVTLFVCAIPAAIGSAFYYVLAARA